MRGHGKSEGPRGDTEEVISVYSDIDKFISFVRENSSMPIFLGGHSSGGGLILNYLSQIKSADLKGVVLLSPELGFRSKTQKDDIIEPFADPKIRIFILSAFTGKRLFCHSIAVKFNYPEVVLKRDPLLIDGITTNMAYSLTPENPTEQMKGISLPTAIIIGEKDELIDHAKLKVYNELIPNSIKEKSPFIVIPNENHLSIILKAHEKIGKILKDWILIEKSNIKTNGNRG